PDAAAPMRPAPGEDARPLIEQTDVPAPADQVPPQGAAAAARTGPSLKPPAAVWWPGLVWLAGTAVLLTRLLVGRVLLLVLRGRWGLGDPGGSGGGRAVVAAARLVGAVLSLRRRRSRCR